MARRLKSKIFYTKRAIEISAREAVPAAIEQNRDYKSLAELKKFSADINNYYIEQLISKLLFRLTRNTGFEVSKGTLGEYWQKDCCEYSARKPDDLCGLDTRRLPLMDKANVIYKCLILKSEFNGELLNIDKLSTGCKTALNIQFNPEKVFSIKECGDNALDIIYGLESGMVFSEYPVIPSDFDKVTVSSGGETRGITDYADLKEWWENEE